VATPCHSPRTALPKPRPGSSPFWAGLPLTHRQICRIGCFSAFCFLPLPLLSSSELEAGATESAAFSSLPSLSPALPTAGISLGRGFLPVVTVLRADATGVEAGRAQLSGGQVKPSAPSRPPLRGQRAPAIILSGRLG
jgi:hypothetical protein